MVLPGVEVIDDHTLRLTFEDGLVGDIDFTRAQLASRVRTKPGSGADLLDAAVITAYGAR